MTWSFTVYREMKRKKPQGKQSSSLNIFQELLETIESLTGVRTVIYDRQKFTTRAGRQAIDPSFSGHRSEFCTVIRTAKDGQDACNLSDVQEATAEATRRGEPLLHTCHGGLVEVVMPVVYRGQNVATVFCGQAVLENAPATDDTWLARRARGLGVDPGALIAARDKLPHISQKKLVEIGKLLFHALSHLAETEGRAALDRALALERDKHVRESLAYVEQHFREPMGIRELSQHVHLTPAYLSRLFHRAMGMTFLDYLTQRRIAEAKELLQNTSMKMSGIAFEVGYSHQSYFGRKFRQFTGMSPLQFRMANRP